MVLLIHLLRMLKLIITITLSSTRIFLRDLWLFVQYCLNNDFDVLIPRIDLLFDVRSFSIVLQLENLLVSLVVIFRLIDQALD